MESDFKRDPWVKVGTTTIDGTFHQVREVFGETWDNVEHMRYHLAAGDVWGIGGRSLMINDRDVFDDVVIISCDIVRRLSECCDYCDRDHLTDAQRERAGECSSCSASIAAKMSSPASVKPTCPECGPHGNRGEVLLASSWAKCTTCAGGKPGDLWGEVQAHEPGDAQGALSSALNKPPSFPTPATAENLMKFEIASGIRSPDGRSFMDARREALLVQLGQGFKVPPLSEMREAELDNLRRHLTKDTPARYDDATIAKWANIVCNLLPGDWIT